MADFDGSLVVQSAKASSPGALFEFHGDGGVAPSGCAVPQAAVSSGPPVLSKLDSELGGIGFAIRTARGRT